MASTPKYTTLIKEVFEEYEFVWNLKNVLPQHTRFSPVLYEYKIEIEFGTKMKSKWLVGLREERQEYGERTTPVLYFRLLDYTGHFSGLALNYRIQFSPTEHATYAEVKRKGLPDTFISLARNEECKQDVTAALRRQNYLAMQFPEASDNVDPSSLFLKIYLFVAAGTAFTVRSFGIDEKSDVN